MNYDCYLSANIRKFSIVMQKSANFFIKKLCFLRFNKLYAAFRLDFAQLLVISHSKYLN